MISRVATLKECLGGCVGETTHLGTVAGRLGSLIWSLALPMVHYYRIHTLLGGRGPSRTMHA